MKRRRFRDGHSETWWALEVLGGRYGPDKAERAVVVTTDPASLPDDSKWYLVTNLPRPSTSRARRSALAEATLAGRPTPGPRLAGAVLAAAPLLAGLVRQTATAPAPGAPELAVAR